MNNSGVRGYLENKSSEKLIFSFFIFLLVQAFLIAFIFVLFLNLNINEVLKGNIPELIQITYATFLYLIIFIDLYTFDFAGFKNVFTYQKKVITFLQGYLIGFLSLSILYIFHFFLDFIEIKNINFDFYVFGEIIILSFAVAFIEEMLFRNFIFFNLNKNYSFFISIIISAYIYSQLHFFNFSLNLIDIIIPFITLFLLGCIFAIVSLKINLWFAIGIHSSFVFLVSAVNRMFELSVNHNFTFFSGGTNPAGGLFGLFFSLVLLFYFLKK